MPRRARLAGRRGRGGEAGFIELVIGVTRRAFSVPSPDERELPIRRQARGLEENVVASMELELDLGHSPASAIR